MTADEDPRTTEFVNEIETVCKKHGYSISVRGGTIPQLIIEDYMETNVFLLRYAAVKRWFEPKSQ
jgi:hypothetical protein